MSVVPLAIEITCVCCLAALLLHHYGNWRKQHGLVTLAVFIAWYFSFMIIFVLPLDVSNTSFRQCIRDHIPPVVSTTPSPNQTIYNISIRDVSNDSAVLSVPNSSSLSLSADHADRLAEEAATETCGVPYSFLPPHILPNLWRVVYWTSQFLTWLLLPMMQSYTNAGDFSVAGKVKTSLINNALYYGTYLLIFLVCLIYVATRPDLHFDGAQLKVLAITASNTWGLFLLVLLLGYGLVDVPRSCWNNSKRGYMLSQTHFKIAKLSTEKSEAEENLEDILEDVKKAAETIRYNHPLRKCVDTILEKCPETLRNSVKRNKDDFQDYNNPTETPTEKSLIRLHKKVIFYTQTYRRTQCQWNMLMEKSFDLEDIALNEASPSHRFTRSFGQYDGVFKMIYSPTVEWYWKVMFQPWVMKGLAIVLCIFSTMVVWSECTFFVKRPVLSFFALFIELAKSGHDYFSIEIASILTIAYLSVCTYYTVFKIRILNYYYIVPHHQTSEYSLTFSGALFCRLTPPMCLNFLGLIHLDSHVTKEFNLEQTAYTQIMGHMDVIPFISNGFNIYFPMVIVLLCFATYFRLGTRLLHCLGFEQFIGEDDMTQELIDEGRELVKRERRKRQRKEDGEQRRRDWNERFGSNSSSHTTSQYQSRSDSDPETGRRGTGKFLVKQSSEENDRTELLKEVEPIDYNGTEINNDFDDLSINNSNGSGFYQSRAAALGRFAASSSGRTSTKPPKGIFDDI